ncbi:hypothetical protein DL96DRAFT_1678212 [Flagelloscypha sp. PMI_526]|nr:hypothetical protein DL96DRAFT_1678212 [Flagelloscypha sp. PMI_526]
MVVSLHRRQDGTLAAVNGLSGGKTVSGIDSIGQTLALDDPTNTLNTFVPTDAIGTVTLSSASLTSSRPSATATQEPVAASSEKFSNGMVVGICVGAFAGALAIILVGVVIYRKSAPKPHQRRPSQQRHRRIESQAGGDSWEGKYPQTRQIPAAPTTASTIAPMEKLTASMFTDKTPSMRSEPSTDGHSHNFAEYRPDLAQEMAEKDGGYLGRIDTGAATLSWGDADGGRMSPMFSRAIPTPQAHDSPLHHAQSAEVINPFGADDDEDDEPERRRSQVGNPFFRSRPPNESVQRTRSRASRASSHKGKSRAKDPSSHGHDDNIDDMYADYSDDEEEGYYSAATNPFSDPTPNQSTATLTQAPLHIENHPYAAPIFQTSATPPPLSPMTAQPLMSPSTPVNDPHAIQGLLAALDIPDGGHNLSVVQGGRGTVMSAQSATSAYSDIDSAVAGQFPAPPA